MVTIKLTNKEAEIIWFSVDGWLDAGACEGGMEPEEKAALLKLREQLTNQKKERTK